MASVTPDLTLDTTRRRGPGGDHPGGRWSRAWARRSEGAWRRLLSVALVVALAAASIAVERGASAAAAEPAVLSNTLGSGEPIAGTDISGLGGQQYRQNNQRNSWWNEDAQRWDGILPTASPPAHRESAWWMWHDLDGDPTAIQLMEDGPARTPDAYWDADERLLYVFFSRGNSGTSKFRRYVYDPVTDRYTEVSRSGGVNAPEMLRGGKRVTIIKSPNGHLWAGVNSGANDEILISRSTDGGNTWPDPVRIKDTDWPGDGHWVTFTQDGRTRVGFAATEDGAAPDARVHFLHLDEDEPDWANPARWTDETELLPDWEGDERADDELSAVMFEDRVFVTIETEPLGDARSSGRPQLIVFEREAGGGWVRHTILRYQSRGAHDAKRPTITVDASARLLIVSAGTTQRTHADLWYAPIDALPDYEEQWDTLRVFEISDPDTENIYTTRTPLPRFPVTAESNLPVLIDDRGDAQVMWRQVVRSSGGGHDPGPPEDRPVINSVAIDQEEPRTDDTLTVTVTAEHPDGAPLTFSYEWFNNDSMLPGEDGASLDLSLDGNGERGDEIAVRVTASDGATSSTPVMSDPVTIVNSPPVFDATLPDRTDTEGSTVTISAGASDPDGDELTYDATGLPEGVSLDPDSGQISGTLATGAAAASPYTVAVTASETSAGEPPPISLVQGTASDLSGTNSLTLTYGQPPTPGNLLVAFGHYGANRVPTIPSGWTLALESNSPGETVAFYRVAGLEEPSEVTLEASGAPIFMSLSIFEYAGLHADQAEVLDRTVHDVASTATSVSTGTTAPTREDDELLLASVGLNGTRDFADAWTNDFDQLTNERRQTVAARIVSSTGAFETTESWTDRTVGTAVGSLLTFRSAMGVREPSEPASVTQTFTWTVTDGTSPGSSPEITAVTLSPTEPRTDDTLETSTTVIGREPISYAYEWRRNGDVLPGEDTATLDLSVEGNGVRGDELSVTVTATDAAGSSQPVTSDAVTVVNSPPAFIQELPDRTDAAGATVGFAAGATDADDDPLTYSAIGLPPGVSIDTSSGDIAGTIAADAAAASPYEVTVTADDGSDQVASAFIWTVTFPELPEPAPGTPVGLSGVSTSIGIDLTWEPGSGESPAGYRVQRSAGGGPYVELSAPLVTETAFRDTTAPVATTSSYRVVAVGGSGATSEPATTSIVRGPISHRASTSATTHNGTDVSLDRPADTVAGDVLLASVVLPGSTQVTAPVGWELVRTDASGSTMRQATYVKALGGNEPDSYTWTFVGRTNAAAVVSAYRGVDADDPIDRSDGQSSGSSGAITAPSLTTGVPQVLLVGFFGTATHASITPPTGMLGQVDAVHIPGRDKLAIASADQIVSEPGATDTRTAAADRDAANVGQLVALRPEGAPGS